MTQRAMITNFIFRTVFVSLLQYKRLLIKSKSFFVRALETDKNLRCQRLMVVHVV